MQFRPYFCIIALYLRSGGTHGEESDRSRLELHHFLVFLAATIPIRTAENMVFNVELRQIDERAGRRTDTIWRVFFVREFKMRFPTTKRYPPQLQKCGERIWDEKFLIQILDLKLLDFPIFLYSILLLPQIEAGAHPIKYDLFTASNWGGFVHNKRIRIKGCCAPNLKEDKETVGHRTKQPIGLLQGLVFLDITTHRSPNIAVNSTACLVLATCVS